MGNSSSAGGIQAFPFRTEGSVILSFLRPEAAELVAVSRSGVESINVKTGVRGYFASCDSIICADVHSNGSIIGVGCLDGSVKILEMATGEVKQTFKTRQDRPAAASSPSVSSVPAPPVKISPITALRFCGSDAVAVGFVDGVAHIWKLSTQSFVCEMTSKDPKSAQPQTNVRAMAIESGRKVWIGYGDGSLRCFDAESGKMLLQVGVARDIGGPPIVSMAFCSRENVLAFATTVGVLHLWDASLSSELAAIQREPMVLHYDDQSGALFGGTSSGKAYIWRVSRDPQVPLATLRKLEVRADCTASIRYSPRVDVLLCGFVGNAVVMSNGVLADVATPPPDAAGTTAAQPPPPLSGGALLTPAASPAALPALSEEETKAVFAELKDESKPPKRTFAQLEKEKTLMELISRQLTLGGVPDAERRSLAMAQEFEKSAKDLAQRVEHVQDTLVATRRSVAARTEKYFNPEVGREEIRRSYERRLEEMKARHQRELQELERHHSDEGTQFEVAIAPSCAHAVWEYRQAQHAYDERQKEAEESVCTKLRTALLSSLRDRPFHQRYRILCAVRAEVRTVFRAIDMLQGASVAVRVLPPNLRVLTSLSHPNLVAVRDVIQSESATFVVLDLMDTTLWDVLNVETGALSSELCASLIHDICSCLEYLHSQGMVARGLKPSSVFVDQRCEVARLVHLGLMKPLSGREPEENGCIFSAPEIFARTVTAASDMWSLGCVIIRMFQTKEQRAVPLFSGSDWLPFMRSYAQYVFIPRGNPLAEGVPSLTGLSASERASFKTLVPSAPDEAVDLIRRLLLFDPASRLTSSQVLNHSFLHKCGQPNWKFSAPEVCVLSDAEFAAVEGSAPKAAASIAPLLSSVLIAPLSQSPTTATAAAEKDEISTELQKSAAEESPSAPAEIDGQPADSAPSAASSSSSSGEPTEGKEAATAAADPTATS